MNQKLPAIIGIAGFVIALGAVGDADCDFNPRSRVGSDCFIPLVRQWYKYFNPRSRVGSDS